MGSQKITLVADSIHGNIQISSLEKMIISTRAFNRLHNIYQNSTVYLTYPSNKTKRFEHSLGVAHLTGLMFFHSLVNADEKVRAEFFEKLNNEIQDTIKEKNEMLRFALGQHVNVVEELPNFPVDEPLYRIFTPNVVGDKYRFAYLVAYQAVRCTALLHDVGHPPFSHITEFALKEVWRNVKDIEDKDLTERQKVFKESIDSYSESGIDLHEVISNKISSRILESIIRNDIKPVNKEEAYSRFFYVVVYRAVQLILDEKPGLFKDLHRIIAGSIDSDRLDYVTRDLQNSGFNHGHIEYDRLACSMRIMKNGEDFIFCPDARTLSTIEDFFQRRWNLYKYVIYHHRVVKTDYLLGNVIVELALDYMKSKEPEEKGKKYVLPFNISGLWKAVKEALSDEDYFNALIQWDDSWLLTVLRQRFFMTYLEQNSVVSNQLEELLSNRKCYFSLIKRMDDFLEIDNIVLQNFKINWDEINQKLGGDWTKVWDKQVRQIMSSEGFVLTKLKEVYEMVTATFQGAFKKDDYQTTIDEIIRKVAVEKFEVKDCIVNFKKLKTGLQESPYLHRNGQLIKLSEVSKINEDLMRNKRYFPTFFIYLTNCNSTFKEFTDAIGKAIGEELTALFNKTLLG